MQVQVTKVKFDIDEYDPTDHLQESLQEEYVGKVFDLDMSHYGTGGWDDEDIAEQLVEEVTCQSGWCVSSLDYRYVLS